MIFQVLKNGKVMFWTEQKECIPSDEIIKNIKQAGYKLKYNESKKGTCKNDNLSK